MRTNSYFLRLREVPKAENAIGGNVHEKDPVIPDQG